MRVDRPDGYWVSDDPSLIDVLRVHHWISRESYWAAGQPYEVMARSLQFSLSLGLFSPEDVLIGFARLVTDRATFAWLCDVFVDAAYRDRGLGTFLVEAATGHPDVAGVRQVLMAHPGRSLYRRVGFDTLVSPERWMERPAADGNEPAAPPPP